MLPIEYKVSAEGSWTSWTGGKVDEELLKTGFGLAYLPYKINGIVVYAFKFSDNKVWNVSSGWIQ